jgi:hypothetical protein
MARSDTEAFVKDGIAKLVLRWQERTGKRATEEDISNILREEFAQVGIFPDARGAVPLKDVERALRLCLTEKVGEWMEIKDLCQHIGLRYDRSRLKRTAERANEWFKQHGGSMKLEFHSDGRRVRFRCHPPETPETPEAA